MLTQPQDSSNRAPLPTLTQRQDSSNRFPFPLLKVGCNDKQLSYLKFLVAQVPERVLIMDFVDIRIGNLEPELLGRIGHF